MERCFESSEKCKPLVPLKATVLLCYGALSSLLPILIFHSNALGFNLQDSGAAFGSTLILAFFAPPLVGYMVDKGGQSKLWLMVLLFSTAVLHSCLLAVPEGSESFKPMNGSFLCTASGGFLTMNVCPPVDGEYHCPFENNTENVEIAFDRCIYDCGNITNDYDELPPEPQLCFDSEKDKDCFSFDSSLFPPSNFTFNYIPRMYESKRECIHRVKSVWYGTDEEGERMEFGEMSCPPVKPHCRLSCSLTMTVVNGTKSMCQLPDSLPNVYSYFILRFLCVASVFSFIALLESLILVKVNALNAKYGMQRAWGYVASLIFAPVAMVAVACAQGDNHRPSGYYPAFVLFDVLLVMAAIVISCTSFPQSSQPKLQFAHTSQLFSVLDLRVLYAAVLGLGVISGASDYYLFPYIYENSSSYDSVVTARAMGSVLSIPAVYYADGILQVTGRITMLVAAFVTYSVQLIVYGYINSPWWAAGLELLNFISTGLKLAAMVTLANSLSPKGLDATVQGFVHSIHYLIGGGVGVLLSSHLVPVFGLEFVLVSFGISSFLFGLVYGVGYSVCKCLRLTHTALPTEPLDDTSTLDHVKTAQSRV